MLLSILTEEEKSVINEFVRGIKDRTGIITVKDVEKSMRYNFHHGKGASYKLLNKVLHYVKEEYSLTAPQFERLSKEAALVAKYEVWRWVYLEELPKKLNTEAVVVNNEGYVILKGGIRIDYGFDYYQHLREDFAKTGVYDEGLR